MILNFMFGKKDSQGICLAYLFGKLGKHQTPGFFGMPVPVWAFPHLRLEDLLLSRVLPQDLLPGGHPLCRERHFLARVSALVGRGKTSHYLWRRNQCLEID